MVKRKKKIIIFYPLKDTLKKSGSRGSRDIFINVNTESLQKGANCWTHSRTGHYLGHFPNEIIHTDKKIGGKKPAKKPSLSAGPRATDPRTPCSDTLLKIYMLMNS